MLEHLCIFENEQKGNEKCSSWRNIIRGIFVVMHIVLFCAWSHIFGMSTFYNFFTNWGNSLSIGSLCLTMYLSSRTDYR